MPCDRTFVSRIWKSGNVSITSGRIVLVFQAFAAAIAAVVGVMGQFLISTGAMWSLILLQVIWGISKLSFTWLFRAEGAQGVAMAYLIAYLIHLATMSAMTFWKFKRQQQLPATSAKVAPVSLA